MALKHKLIRKRKQEENNDAQPKWANRQRIFATRGINHRHRHLMEDLKILMPHHRPECKMERTKTLQMVNEMCKMKNCNKVVLFEGQLKQDLYM
ncbi:Brix domain-containing protein 2-like protein [Harpegnathos saltator]|uniref:Ribosome biogenesis protein BRX1 homolog n=1 Tax=Harpegnathos saltator TaxID=610380 RepID=E2BJM3_HARSA|nr:Brix domain-containing protein 2-like protein [Harpegnathos saltator]